MTDKITYYAIFDEDTSRENPRTVLRRVETGEGQVDELFSRDSTWKRSPLLHAANRGDTMFDFTEISKEEVDQIVGRIRTHANHGEWTPLTPIDSGPALGHCRVSRDARN